MVMNKIKKTGRIRNVHTKDYHYISVKPVITEVSKILGEFGSV